MLREGYMIRAPKALCAFGKVSDILYLATNDFYVFAGCMMQIENGLLDVQGEQTVVHVVDILDEAYALEEKDL